MSDVAPTPRILLVDDNPAIHSDFRRILTPRKEECAEEVDALAVQLFGEPSSAEHAMRVSQPDFQLDSVLQGELAVPLVRAALDEGRPYSLAFVDMRMPPGWDGLTTILHLWEIDPDLQIVICTAYSDRSWLEIQAKLTARHRWLVLKKPFDKVEVLQLAQSLTEKWHLEQLDRQRAALLEEAVRARTEQLRRAIQVKNEFLANVSHELLTPMNGIIGMQTLLADTPMDAEQLEMLTSARQCSASLLELVERVLAFNQAEAGTLRLTPESTCPSSLLREVADAYAARARQRGLDLTSDGVAAGSTAALPKNVVRQLLSLLVDNAVKFTQQGRVSLAATRVAGGIQFSVIDTGPGLSSAELDLIAMPFAQVDGRLTRRFGGLGLGLSLARRLASSLGGVLELRSEPGQGTTASFVVPVSVAQEHPADVGL